MNVEMTCKWTCSHCLRHESVTGVITSLTWLPEVPDGWSKLIIRGEELVYCTSCTTHLCNLTKLSPAERLGDFPPQANRYITFLMDALQPLVDIGYAYHDNGLDECRPDWETRGVDKKDLERELYCGRGGRALIKLKDALRAVEVAEKLREAGFR